MARVKSAKHHQHTLFTPAFVLVLLVQFFYGTAYSTFFVLPKYLMEELGASATLVGNAHGAFSLAGAVAVPFVGIAADRIGRKALLLVGALLAALTYAPLGAVESPALILALRAAHGVAFSMVFSSGAALAVDIAPEARRAEAVGYFGTAMMVTNGFGPVLAEVVAERWGWASVFAACSAFAGVAFLAALALTPPKFTRALSSLLIPSSTPLLGVYLAAFGVGVGIGVSKTFVPAAMVEEGVSRLAPFFLAYTAGALFQRTVFARLPDRVGHLRATVLAFLFYAAAVLGLAATSFDWVVPLAILAGLAHGVLYPASAALSMDVCASDERGRVSALFAGFFNLGFAAGASALAPAEPWFGYRGLLVLGSVVVVACAWGVRRLVAPKGWVPAS